MRGDWNTHTLLSWLAALAILATGGEAAGYFGKRIGRLEELHHLVQGEVYAVDSRTIHIRGFSYDGTAPDAFFYGGSTPSPSDAGFIIPDENGGVQPLGRYRNKDLTLTLPDGKTLKDIKWLSVWCRAFAIDFGNVRIPASLDYPRPQKIDALPTYEHGVSSDRIVVVDAQTFLIPNFNYDGQAPDGHFWVGKGSSPGPAGNMVPDENGSEEPLKRYSGKTIVITLPGEQTVFDIDYLSVWCRAFFADFGHVRIPKNLNVPPSLKMLGVAPQTKLNCEVLWDDLAFEVRWAVAGESIVMQLVGRIENGQYMAFGPSGSLTRSVMVGGDVVVAWLNQGTGEGVASDYYLGAKAQCQGGRGSCPDDKIRGSGNNVRLLNAALINEFTMLTFQRPLRAVDISDTGILTNGSQAVIWAIGPVNSQGDTSYHTLRLRGDMFIDFGRTPRWNCPLPEEQGGPSQGLVSGPATPPPAPPTNNAWYIPPVPCYEPADGVFYAQIGPSGGDSGYNAITGHVGWGVAWYINGLLIPEINVVRGKTYTFVVEGGYDPERPARYHPFYITDDPEGGYEFKTPAERAKSRVFAGVGRDRDGLPVPTAFGRLCEWTENPNQPSNAFQSFGAYQRTLELNCQEGQPGILQWTPDAATPDTVYYQCYTHRYLGWKINVVDQCDFEPLQAAGTVEDPVVVPGPQEDGEVMKAAESTQLFTTDGRRLPPESLPAPPELSRRRVTAASITNRPQVGVFRGEHPPPIPDHVPHLPQFSRQRRPSNRRTTVPPPPLPDSISPEILIPHHQDNPRPAAGLLHHQPLSADVGQNRVLAVDQFPTTAAAYAPSRPPATPPTTASSANSRTKLTILKDVWAILTRDDPSLKNQHHPRDDAHPKHDHDHLDRQERRRRRRKRAEPERDLPPHASSSLPLRTSSLGLLSILVFLVALAR